MRLLGIVLLSVAFLALGGCYLSVPFEGLSRGTAAPPLGVSDWLNSPDGGTPRLASDSGTPVLVEFWSRECGPCRSSIPKLKAIAEAYGEDLRIVTVHVNLDEGHPQDPEAIRHFVEANGITYPVGIDASGDLWRRYDFNYLPHAVVVGSDGSVLWSGNLVAWSLERGLSRTVGPPSRKLNTDGLPAVSAEHAECEDGVCVID